MQGQKYYYVIMSVENEREDSNRCEKENSKYEKEVTKMRKITTARADDYNKSDVMGYAIVKIMPNGKPKLYSGCVIAPWVDFSEGDRAKIYDTKKEAKKTLSKLLDSENKLLFLTALAVADV